MTVWSTRSCRSCLLTARSCATSSLTTVRSCSSCLMTDCCSTTMTPTSCAETSSATMSSCSGCSTVICWSCAVKTPSWAVASLTMVRACLGCLMRSFCVEMMPTMGSRLLCDWVSPPVPPILRSEHGRASGVSGAVHCARQTEPWHLGRLQAGGRAVRRAPTQKISLTSTLQTRSPTTPKLSSMCGPSYPSPGGSQLASRATRG
mmetsp:Transcript_18950/g.36864  ORF Transcript_18950/g.36864 Transcript_18950/m.36864 type:complete len:204 (-) Transcript_18950:904-1515(-)